MGKTIASGKVSKNMKFDLHIHSNASIYKESDGIVNDSTVDNVEVLLKNLNNHEVGLFSITDHNRFNTELYKRIDEELETRKYENVKGVVAGVEFDVRIDDEMEKCHIITIFDVKNKIENYSKIECAINENKLTKKDEYYTKAEFESIIREIGLDVILIACQRSSLQKHDGKHNSLSESTHEPENLIMTGYINALEFQRPNVEGILKNNLKDMPLNVGLVMGSDCHEWNAYPNHDEHNCNNQFIHSRAEILPTFKGLLMAITSPETRINQQENRNPHYIKSFKICDREISLINGINAIIGENGSGKSSLLKLLSNEKNLPQYVKTIIKENQLDCDNANSSRKLFIEQGEVIKKFDNCTLFPKENFLEVNHSEFKDNYTLYAQNIMRYIKHNISKEETVNGLEKKFLEHNEVYDSSTYFLQVECDQDFTNINNAHEVAKKNISQIIELINKLLVEPYFDEYKSKLDEATKLLSSIFDEVNQRYQNIENEKIVKNIIVSKLSNYNFKKNEAATSKERDQNDFNNKKSDFIRSIFTAIQQTNKINNFPEKPVQLKGISKRACCGFNFNSEANYHDRDVYDEFLKAMFNQKYANVNELKKINKMEMLIDAIRGCTSYDQLDDTYETNLKKFISQSCECKNFMVDISNDVKTIGSTLGEQSLAYFKYITEYETEKCIFLIDQPEDHISNNNISNKLIRYLNSIRRTKQIIIVTHNPLLVVNLDVEQVIVVEKSNNKINLLPGCLELENEEVNMLKLIADNMDGGKMAIEKRLRVYG